MCQIFVFDSYNFILKNLHCSVLISTKLVVIMAKRTEGMVSKIIFQDLSLLIVGTFQTRVNVQNFTGFRTHKSSVSN